jgi:hypothetical protein
MPAAAAASLSSAANAEIMPPRRRLAAAIAAREQAQLAHSQARNKRLNVAAAGAAQGSEDRAEAVYAGHGYTVFECATAVDRAEYQVAAAIHEVSRAESPSFAPTLKTIMAQTASFRANAQFIYFRPADREVSNRSFDVIGESDNSETVKVLCVEDPAWAAWERTIAALSNNLDVALPCS